MYPAGLNEKNGHFQTVVSYGSKKSRFNSLLDGDDKNEKKNMCEKLGERIISKNNQNEQLQKNSSKSCGRWTAAFCVEATEYNDVDEIENLFNENTMQANIANKVSIMAFGKELTDSEEEMKKKHL